MAYLVELTKRAATDLESIFLRINAEESTAAAKWFNGLETAILSLERLPKRVAAKKEIGSVRCLLYGRKPHVYRILYSVDEPKKLVYVLHVRYGARRPLPSSKRKPRK